MPTIEKLPYIGRWPLIANSTIYASRTPRLLNKQSTPFSHGLAVKASSIEPQSPLTPNLVTNIPMSFAGEKNIASCGWLPMPIPT